MEVVTILTGQPVQSEEIKCDPEMDKSAVWAGSGCTAVFLISRSCLISPPGTKFIFGPAGELLRLLLHSAGDLIRHEGLEDDVRAVGDNTMHISLPEFGGSKNHVYI